MGSKQNCPFYGLTGIKTRVVVNSASIQLLKIKEPLMTGNRMNRGRLHIGVILHLLLMLFLLSGSASAQEMNTLLKTPVQLSMNQGTIEGIITELMTNHQINFSFDPKIIPHKKQITLEVANQTLDGILSQTFKGTDVKYTVIKEIVILSKKRDFLYNL